MKEDDKLYEKKGESELPSDIKISLPTYEELSEIPLSQLSLSKNIPFKKNSTIQKLSKLVPYNYVNKSISTGHPHLIDLYFIAREYLTVEVSESPNEPAKEAYPYSDQSRLYEKITRTQYLYEDDRNWLRVIEYLGESGNLYVLKRLWKPFDINNKKKEHIHFKEIDNFIEKSYLEFGLMKLFCACPHSSMPISFNIILLKGQNLIVTELLMDHGGVTLSADFFNDSKTAYKLFYQIVSALNYLECFKLEHNDIKDSNILLDENNILIKFIDFDIGINESCTLKSTKEGIIPKGYTETFAAPEVKKYFKMRQDNKTVGKANLPKINPWYSQIYSSGILFLTLKRFFQNYERFVYNNEIEKDPQKFKESYQKFIDQVKEFGKKQEKKDLLLSNLIKICEISISFEPEERLTANELMPIFPKLESFKQDELMKEYKKIIENRKKSEIGNEKSQIESFHILSNQYIYNSAQSNLNKEVLEKQDDLENKINSLTETLESMKEEEEKYIKEIQLKNLEINAQKIKLNNTKLLLDESIKEITELIDECKNKNTKLLNSSENIKNFTHIYEKLIGKLELIINKFKIEIESVSKIISTKSIIDIRSLITREEEIQITRNGKTYTSLPGLDPYSSENEFLKMNKKINRMGIINTSECKNFSELTEKLFVELCKLKIDRDLRTNTPKLLKREIEQRHGHFSDISNYYHSAKYYGEITQNTERFIPNGKGMIFFNNGSRYFGNIALGKRSNFGIMYQANGTAYIGGFENDIYHGLGIMIMNLEHNIRQYEYYFGEWSSGKIKGFGKYNWGNGTIYDGDWKNNLRHGKGKLIFNGGGIFIGEWKKDERFGRGVYLFESGVIYIGEIHGGGRNGKGMELHPDGTMFIGNWKESKMNGRFKIVSPDGTYKIQYIYMNDNLGDI